MKNLATRRSEAWTEHGRNLYCPHSPDYKPCSTEYCAHYNPDTNECVHVEAAMAQVKMASAMLNTSSNLEQLRRWVADRE